MSYSITHGPHGARETATPRTIKDAANAIRDLTKAKAENIEVLRDGEPIDPRFILSASPASGRITRRG